MASRFVGGKRRGAGHHRLDPQRRHLQRLLLDAPLGGARLRDSEHDPQAAAEAPDAAARGVHARNCVVLRLAADALADRPDRRRLRHQGLLELRLGDDHCLGRQPRDRPRLPQRARPRELTGYRIALNGTVASAKNWAGYGWFMTLGTFFPLITFLVSYAVHLTLVGAPVARAGYRFGIWLATFGQDPPGKAKLESSKEGKKKRSIGARIK